MQKEKLQAFTITRRQQKKLFVIAYAEQEKETKRLVSKYYHRKWSAIHSKIQQVLVDLKFRGDFRPGRRSQAMNAVKAAVLANSISAFKKAISKRSFWKNVPYDRFRRRVAFM